MLHAADSTLPQAPDPLASTGRVMIFLLLVIGLIVLLAWLVTKVRGTRFIPADGQIRVIASQPLGIKEKIAVLQIGDKQIVVGVTAQQITLLTELDEPLTAAAGHAPASFQELLKKAIRS